MKHMFLYDCFMVYHHFSLHDTGWCISHFWTNPNLIHEITFLSLGKLPSNDDSVGMRWDGHYPTHSSLGPRCKQSKRQPQTPWCSKALREGFHDRFGQKERCLEPRAPKATLVGASTISTVKFPNSKRSLTTFGRGKNTLYLIWSTPKFPRNGSIFTGNMFLFSIALGKRFCFFSLNHKAPSDMNRYYTDHLCDMECKASAKQ
jgi:hypothetical protein